MSSCLRRQETGNADAVPWVSGPKILEVFEPGQLIAIPRQERQDYAGAWRRRYVPRVPLKACSHSTRAGPVGLLFAGGIAHCCATPCCTTRSRFGDSGPEGRMRWRPDPPLSVGKRREHAIHGMRSPFRRGQADKLRGGGRTGARSEAHAAPRQALLAESRDGDGSGRPCVDAREQGDAGLVPAPQVLRGTARRSISSVRCFTACGSHCGRTGHPADRSTCARRLVKSAEIALSNE